MSFFTDTRWRAFGFETLDEDRLRLIGLPEGWKKIWILYVDGAVAIGANDGRRELSAQLERGPRVRRLV